MREAITDAEVDSIEGWFWQIDIALFRFFLGSHVAGSGDLAELGVYLGKSAALIGSYRAPGETFTVIDLFSAAAGEDLSAKENRKWYPGLSQERFESNYRRIHADLPVVLRGTSNTIATVASHGTHRFVHVDASHVYENVVSDIGAAKALLGTKGVVVFDDFRSPHTPGVAAAVWQEVANGLVPLVLSPYKFYGTWGEPHPWRAALQEWLANDRRPYEVTSIAGEEIYLLEEPQPLLERWVPPAALGGLQSVKSRFSELRRHAKKMYRRQLKATAK